MFSEGSKSKKKIFIVIIIILTFVNLFVIFITTNDNVSLPGAQNNLSLPTPIGVIALGNYHDYGGCEICQGYREAKYLDVKIGGFGIYKDIYLTN